jgi:hypothetical protein
MKRLRPLFILAVLILSACNQQAQVVPLTATQTTIPTETIIPSTEMPTSIPFTPTAPDPTADPTIFGAIGTNEIQAFALESVANAIFNKTMDSVIADGHIQEYQVMSVNIFPGSNGLLSEIIFNVRTTDPVWIAEGGTPTTDNWLNGMCYRFDFFTTETEYQLKNRRLCG